jgi:hypothetical protein
LHKEESPFSIGCDRNPKHLRFRSEVESPVRLVAIQDAEKSEGAVFVNAFFNAKKLPMLPFAVDLRGRRLSASRHDVSGFPLLLGAGRSEINSASVSGNEELIVLELRDQGAPDGLGISFGGAPAS